MIDSNGVDWSNCKGCDCYNNEEALYTCAANITPIRDTIKCPCLKCLLKMCCSDACPEFKDYTDRFDRNK